MEKALCANDPCRSVLGDELLVHRQVLFAAMSVNGLEVAPETALNSDLGLQVTRWHNAHTVRVRTMCHAECMAAYWERATVAPFLPMIRRRWIAPSVGSGLSVKTSKGAHPFQAIVVQDTDEDDVASGNINHSFAPNSTTYLDFDPHTGKWVFVACPLFVENPHIPKRPVKISDTETIGGYSFKLVDGKVAAVLDSGEVMSAVLREIPPVATGSIRLWSVTTNDEDRIFVMDNLSSFLWHDPTEERAHKKIALSPHIKLVGQIPELQEKVVHSSPRDFNKFWREEPTKVQKAQGWWQKHSKASK